MIKNNPFLFAEKLLTFIKGDEMPEAEEQEIEEVIKANHSIRNLYEELQSKDEISEQLSLISTFDVEKALTKVSNGHFRRHRYIIMFRAIAALIVIGLIVTITYLEIDDWEKNSAYNITQIGTGITTITTSDGQIHPLDSMQQPITDEGLTYEVSEGTLILKETNTDKTISPEINSVTTNTINVPNKSIYKLILQDGTKVTLNSGSSLEFPTSFQSNDRIVKLNGEAYFEVMKSQDKRFIVEMNNGLSITVLGTTFNAKSYNDEKEVYTTLIKGSILLNYEGNSKKIIPGEQAIYNKDEQTVNIKYVDTKQYTSWTDKMFDFDNTTLDNIMNQLSRWYDLNIEYTNTGLNAKNTYYSGKVKMYDHPIDVLRKFEKSGELKFELKDGTIVISKK